MSERTPYWRNIFSAVPMPVFFRREIAAWIFLVMGFLSFPGGNKLLAGELTPVEEQGRQVYLAEGCIHCHSQYVRPQVQADVERWGPARPVQELFHESPPLPGNRRQGPDLSNVANRRSPEWNRLHLLSPRKVSPGSRMPSYAHLFAGDGNRGAALVAYLAALGADTFEERLESTRQWQPAVHEPALSPESSTRLFQKSCAQCHGPAGRGDGPLVTVLAEHPPDWKKEDWRLTPGGNEALLARLIKFGVPGSIMAGHESLTDGEIVGLTRYIKSLHK